MKLGIMQPYFLPYIGYFQLISAVDQFIVYDNIQYSKKGWINRNRFLLNGKDALFSLPLRKAADNLNVVERSVAENFNSNKLLNQLHGAYAKAPHFDVTFALLERIFSYEHQNLFRYIYHSLVAVCVHLGIETSIIVSSEVEIAHDLKAQDKVLALCKASAASTYVNLMGGSNLYSKGAFLQNGLDLKFIKTSPFEYQQFGNNFVPWLSIVDVLMFNSLDEVRCFMFNGYELI